MRRKQDILSRFSWWKRIAAGAAILALACFFFSSPIGEAQNVNASRRVYDPTTEQLLNQLQSHLMRGNFQEAQQLMQRIIDGSGFIQPLAEIYYQLAHNETNGPALVKHYLTIINHWPESAWAQKAVIELAPLIIMSGGRWGLDQESLIWDQSSKILTPSPDAVNLGDNPEDLRADAFIQLLHLAHFRNDDAWVNNLLADIPPRAAMYQDQIDLARAFAYVRSGDRRKTSKAFQDWLAKYKNSDFRPLAILALYSSSEGKKQMDEALEMVEAYHDTLEAVWLRSSLSGDR